MSGEEGAVRVLRDDDPAAAGLLQGGWRVRHRSWGARLRADRADTAALAGLVERATAAGCRVEELGQNADAGLIALAAATRGDFPGGPATAPPVLDPAALAHGRAAGTRWFGALQEGLLVAATDVRRGDDRAETGTTAVLPAHRRRGLAEAVKAASVLALLADGAEVLGTGGADENAASLAMNRRLGYEVVERWLTLVPPA